MTGKLTIHNRDIDRLMRQFQKFGVDIEPRLKTAVNQGCLLVESEAKRSIQGGPKTGKVYKRRSVTHQASAPGEAPATDRGRLVSSINVVENKQKKAFSIGVSLPLVKYALRLEKGFIGTDGKGRTYHQEPRPFLRPAFKKMRPQMLKLIKQVMTQAIKEVTNARRPT